MYGSIYKITNLINDKVYIGQTTQTLNRRLRQHLSDAKNKNSSMLIHKAMKKYKENHFLIECIDKAISKKELDIKEVYYIIKYHSNHRDYGYNMKDTIDNKEIASPELRKKYSDNAKKQLERKGKKFYEFYHVKSLGTKSKNSTSNYMGVCLDKRLSKWSVSFDVNKKTYFVGTFKTELEAAKAYDIKVLEIVGPKAKLNFPHLKNKYLSFEINVINEKRIKSSQYKGVTKHTKWNAFYMKIYINKKLICEHFKTEIDAAKRYNELVIFYNLDRPINIILSND